MRKGVVLEKLSGTPIATIAFNRPQKHNAFDLQSIESYLRALEEVRQDDEVRVVITKGTGSSFSSGLDLHYLRTIQRQPSPDWERSSLPRDMAEAVRSFPKPTIAQVHGYCLGHAMVLMLAHDLAIAAVSAQIGMPELRRGSFGQMATASLFHAGIPAKKAALVQLSGRYLSGVEADRLGLVSQSVQDEELDIFTRKLAEEIATCHPAALASAKIAVQMGAKMGVSDAIRLDQLVGAWQQLSVDPVAHVDDYLDSQSGGPNPGYRRPDS
jgi:enoyl-CoA hydratase/carnithine racemase